jgi:hypothetical protein
MSPCIHKSDQFVAVCSNALLGVVILISVLLKMNSAYIAEQAADGFDREALSMLLVASNLSVVVVSVGAYAVSARQVANDNGTPAEGDKGILEQPLLDSALPEQSAQGPIGCEQRARPQSSHRDRWASAPVGMRTMASQPAMIQQEQIALGDSFCGTLGGTRT